MDEFPFNEDEIEITETRSIRRLKVSHVFESILMAFNLERGGLYTVKQLFVNPGELAEEYVAKGRLRFMGPFRLLIITTTITFFILQNSVVFQDFRSGFYEGIQNDKLYAFIENSSRYFNILLWLFVPIAALFSWVFNLKRGYNYAENLAFQTYVFSLTNIIAMLTIFDRLVNPTIVISVVYLGFTIYYVYSYKVFFKKAWWRSIVDVAVQYFLSSTIYFMLQVAIMLLAFAYLK